MEKIIEKVITEKLVGRELPGGEIDYEQSKEEYLQVYPRVLAIPLKTGQFIDMWIYLFTFFLAERASCGVFYSKVSARAICRKAEDIFSKITGEDIPFELSYSTVARSLKRLRGSGYLVMHRESANETYYIIAPSGGVEQYFSDRKRNSFLESIGSRRPCVTSDVSCVTGDTPCVTDDTRSNIDIEHIYKTTTTTEPDSSRKTQNITDPGCGSGEEITFKVSKKTTTTPDTPRKDEKPSNPDPDGVFTDSEGVIFTKDEVFETPHMPLKDEGIAHYLDAAGSLTILNCALHDFHSNWEKGVASGNRRPINNKEGYLLVLIDAKKEASRYEELENPVRKPRIKSHPKPEETRKDATVDPYKSPFYRGQRDKKLREFIAGNTTDDEARKYIEVYLRFKSFDDELAKYKERNYEPEQEKFKETTPLLVATAGKDDSIH